MTELDAYFAGGLTSGWTSGLLSGYAPTIVSSDTAGVLRVKAHPVNMQGNTGRITVVYRAASEICIAIWEETIGASPGNGSIYGILLKGGRNEKSADNNQG